MTIVVETTRDLDTGVTTVRLDGELTFATAPTVRTVLAKCASECPAGVVVDLDALRVANPALLVLFAAAAQRAGAQWGVPLLLCCAQPDVASRISHFRTFTEIYDGPGSAMEALRGWVPRWRHQRFPPVAASAALARRLVAQACTEWGLPGLSEPGMLIVSELVRNAIEHAGTDFDVTVSYTSTFLRIAVQDGGPALPPWVPDGVPDPVVSERGFGLYIVDAAATAWNTTGIADGKIVWALLRVRPPDSPQALDNPAFEPPHGHGMAQTVADGWSRHDDPATKPHGSSLRRVPVGEDLSDREAEVLAFLRTSLTVGEIGTEMHVSGSAVKAHVRSIYRKLGVSRRRDAIFRAYESGLLS